MVFEPTTLPGAVLVTQQPHADERGQFARVYCEREFARQGLPARMVQANVSQTARAGTLRGMHYQAAPHEEDKLVQCMRGAIWDAIVDVRPGSPTRGRWYGVELTASNGRMLLVPKGFAHGFVTLSDDVLVSYLMSEVHVPSAARGARHDDPAFGIAWPVPVRLVSEADRAWPDFDVDRPVPPPPARETP